MEEQDRLKLEIIILRKAWKQLYYGGFPRVEPKSLDQFLDGLVKDEIEYQENREREFPKDMLYEVERQGV